MRDLFIIRITSILLLTGLLVGCAPSPSVANLQGTVDALTARLQQTTTSAAPVLSSAVAGQATALATEAPVAVSGAATTVATNVAGLATTVSNVIEGTTTQQSATPTQDQAATQAAVSAAQATQAAAQPVQMAVSQFDVDPSKGHIGWIAPTTVLEVQGKNQSKFATDFGSGPVVASNFVISADITWDTKPGDSGCGFAVRSDGNSRAPSMYLIGITRFASGHIGFIVMSKGDIVNSRDLYPYVSDHTFNDESGATNQLTVVGIGNKFKIYTNGRYIGTADPTDPPVEPQLPAVSVSVPGTGINNPSLKATEDATLGEMKAQFAQVEKKFNSANKVFPQGITALAAITNFGKVTCTFQNAYLWIIDN